MKLTLGSMIFAATLAFMPATHAAITGDVTGGGIFFDNVDTDNGWIVESAAGNGVDFWTLTASENAVLSVEITSNIDFGISVYAGEVSDDLGFAFDNNADFSDPITFELGTYIGGTNGDFGEAGSALFDLLLPQAGIYTIAVGGDLGFGGFGGPFDYEMDIKVVPIPAALPLLLSGLLGLFAFSRKRA